MLNEISTFLSISEEISLSIKKINSMKYIFDQSKLQGAHKRIENEIEKKIENQQEMLDKNMPIMKSKLKQISCMINSFNKLEENNRIQKVSSIKAIKLIKNQFDQLEIRNNMLKSFNKILSLIQNEVRENISSEIFIYEIDQINNLKNEDHKKYLSDIMHEQPQERSGRFEIY